jgi:hypothetical protein
MSSLIGVIADTDGAIRAEALEALSGADRIIHAGDVGSPDVLDALGTIGPVTAVRGNNDAGAWAASLARSQIVEVEDVRIYVIHDLADLDVDPSAVGLHAVISGHFDKPSIETRDGILYLHPGSAGRRRSNFPATVARLHVAGQTIDPEIVHLNL